MSDEENITVEQPVQAADGVREKEQELLRRMVILIQDASDRTIFVGRVEMFEAMLQEDIEKNKIDYRPAEIVGTVRAGMGLKPTQSLGVEGSYIVAIEKFKRLYRVFKESHIPISEEAKL